MVSGIFFFIVFDYHFIPPDSIDMIHVKKFLMAKVKHLGNKEHLPIKCFQWIREVFYPLSILSKGAPLNASSTS